ncbi:MAG: transposase [Lachnospiraceae bacterium]|nr:transposase [Lachnospiraceae bacterium]
MPRKARRESHTKYYHVIVRGVGKQILFENDNDYSYYLSLMKRFSVETGIRICAYCLMENHVHLLVYDPEETLSVFMKKTGVCYAGYYNTKYERTGHLFQDRFMSEPVETKEYMLTVFRYILNNPEAAGICPASEYRWSSYHLYGNRRSFVNTTLLFSWIGDWEHYVAFMDQENHDKCPDYDYRTNDDDWAKETLYETLGLISGSELKAYSKAKRDEALRQLRRAGLTIKQIERLTGIGRGIVQRAGK